MNRYSYLILRFAAAASMFGHGIVRVPKIQAFSAGMVKTFAEKSYLPIALVLPMSYIIPIVELITGVLLILGLFTKQALIAAGALMVLLIIGSCSMESWEGLTSQIIHAALFAVLLQFLPANTLAVDGVLRRKA